MKKLIGIQGQKWKGVKEIIFISMGLVCVEYSGGTPTTPVSLTYRSHSINRSLNTDVSILLTSLVSPGSASKSNSSHAHGPYGSGMNVAFHFPFLTAIRPNNSHPVTWSSVWICSRSLRRKGTQDVPRTGTTLRERKLAPTGGIPASSKTVGKMSITVEKDLTILSWLAEAVKGGYRRINGTRIPPSDVKVL
jgi:hypothetical protein